MLFRSSLFATVKTTRFPRQLPRLKVGDDWGDLKTDDRADAKVTLQRLTEKYERRHRDRRTDNKK